jgi:hypothetical protein
MSELVLPQQARRPAPVPAQELGALNCPTIVSFAITSLPWGAFGRGGSPMAIGSGAGHVHNTLLFDHVQKGVLRCPFVFRWAAAVRGAGGSSTAGRQACM